MDIIWFPPQILNKVRNTFFLLKLAIGQFNQSSFNFSIQAFLYPIPLHCLRLKVVWSLTKKNSVLKFVTLHFEVNFLYLFKKYHSTPFFIIWNMNPENIRGKKFDFFLAIWTIFHSNFFPRTH